MYWVADVGGGLAGVLAYDLLAKPAARRLRARAGGGEPDGSVAEPAA